MLLSKALRLRQHADDQVETLLLALSRGAGLPGLAAMPARWQRGGMTFHRPLLAGARRRRCATGCVARGEAWVEDPSNADERFTRNRIRARLLPALEAAFPQFRETFARSAAACGAGAGPAARGGRAGPGGAGRAAADRRACRRLSAAAPGQCAAPLAARRPRRQRRARRSSNELLDQIAACTTRGHRIHLKVGQGFVRGRAIPSSGTPPERGVRTACRVR